MNNKCPGCSKPFRIATSALSRFDNKTPICAVCGHAEGIAQFAAAQTDSYVDPREDYAEWSLKAAKYQ